MSAVVLSKGISQITEKWRPKPKLHYCLPKLPPNFLHSSCSPARAFSPLTPKASVSSADYVVEPATSEFTVPGCSGSLVLLGTGYFRISLSLSSQALLWKILTDPAATDYPHPLHSLIRLLPSAAFLFLWSLALFSLIALSVLYSLRVLRHFPSVRAEFSHHVGGNYLFAPWISSLLLLQSAPFLHPRTTPYVTLWWFFSVPILVLDVKIYGQWFTKGKKFLSMVANPTSQITVLGNFVAARAAAQMGFKEGATCLFSLGMVHYFVLFVTLYQRFLGSDTLPAMMRPVFFLFFAVPSMASVAWYSINSRFDTACKMLFFLSLFLFASLVSRPALFKRSLRRFNVAWWDYSFPLTLLAHAATRYAQEVKAEMANVLMLIFSMLSVIVTLALMAFTAIKSSDILPRDDLFVSSSVLPRTASTEVPASPTQPHSFTTEPSLNGSCTPYLKI